MITELGSFIYSKKLAMYKTCETTSHLPRLQHAHMPLNGHVDCIPSDMTCSRRALPTLVNAMSHELRLAASRVYGLPGIRGFGGRAAHNRIVKSAEHVASRGSFGWKLVSYTLSVCPPKRWRSSPCGLLMSYTYARPSVLPVATSTASCAEV